MYVITGADGFLGSYLIKTILENTDEDIIAAARTKELYGAATGRVIPCTGELTDDNYLKILAEKINNCGISKIIYTAACHNIDFVAENPQYAENVNVKIPEKFISMLDDSHKLFFTSSDTVYGEGGTHAFREDEKLCPVSIYGQQKAQGEKVFIKKGGTALRLPLLFSESIAVKKKHFCDKLCSMLRNGESIQLATNAVRSTLDYGTAAELIIKLTRVSNLPDIINVAGDDAFSKYDSGLLVAERLGVSKELIIPVASWGEYKPGAERTDSTLLDNTRIKEILGIDSIKIKL